MNGWMDPGELRELSEPLRAQQEAAPVVPSTLQHLGYNLSFISLPSLPLSLSPSLSFSISCKTISSDICRQKGRREKERERERRERRERERERKQEIERERERDREREGARKNLLSVPRPAWPLAQIGPAKACHGLPTQFSRENGAGHIRTRPRGKSPRRGVLEKTMPGTFAHARRRQIPG